MHQQNPHENRRIFIVTHTAICGVQVRCGLRQSMPSSSIESWARTSVITLKPAIRYQFKTGQRDWPKT